MKSVALEEKYILEYVKDMLNSFKLGTMSIDNDKFHHNTTYEYAPSIIKYGILSLRELNKLGLRHDSEEFLEIMDDIDSHINGIDGVSLSILGLSDNDRNKFLFDPISTNNVDFLVDKDIPVARCGSNYDNEYICRRPILPGKLCAVDIRLLGYADTLVKEKQNLITIEGLVSRYNALKDIAIAVKNSNLNIPLREMSNDEFTIDVDKIVTSPKLVLKK